MAFLAPLVGAALGGSLAHAAVATVAGLGFQALQAQRAKKDAKRAAAAAAAGQQKTGVVPLPDEASPGVRYRIEQVRRQARARRGYQSTLVTGQLGDNRAPATSAPLVLGGVG